jgi:hypothetical protein
MKTKILIFGTGSGSVKALELIDLFKTEIVAYIDNDTAKQGKFINDIPIIKPGEIKKLNYDYIIIASIYYSEIATQLYELGVERKKIVKIFEKQNTKFRNEVIEIYENNHMAQRILKEESMHLLFKDYAVCDMQLSDRNRKIYLSPDYILKGIDYVRISTVELIAREVQDKNVTGAIAELGVYKGDFSLVLDRYFPNKKLYLFDTFAGFAEADVIYDINNDFSSSKVGHLGDSSVEMVLQRLNNRDQCIIKKGYFPESAHGLEDEIFAFVSIDTDLYLPTFEGLSFFYPRLSKGGYILIHDYNHKTYTGVKKAVRDFCDREGINLIPVSDYFGSAIISK